eukprot:10645041-Lingulodinium_polyedra.AAC.1
MAHVGRRIGRGPPGDIGVFGGEHLGGLSSRRHQGALLAPAGSSEVRSKPRFCPRQLRVVG